MKPAVRVGIVVGVMLAVVVGVVVWIEAGVEVRVLCGNVRLGADAATTRAMFDTGNLLDVDEPATGVWLVSSPWELRSSRCRVEAAAGEVTGVTLERPFDLARVAGGVGLALVAALGLFQGALAAGAPWGAAAWGGRHPGRLPTRLRWASAASVPLLVVGGWALFLKARPFDAARPLFLGSAAWVGPVLGAFTVLFAASVVGNVLSASRIERRIGIPAAVLAWACFLTVLLAK